MDRTSWRILALLVALAILAFSTWSSTHWDPVARKSSPYAGHLDEYLHWGYAEASVSQGTAEFADPFDAGARAHPELSFDVHERGFQSYVGAFQQATGISWIDIFEFGPAVVSVLIGLCAFALLEPWDAGVEAVALLGLVPTTIRFLGPGYLVPIIFAIPMILAGFYLLAIARAPLLVGVIALAIWPIHAMGGAIFSAMVLLWAVFAPREQGGRIAAAAVVALAFLAAWPFYGPVLKQTSAALVDLPPDLDQVRLIGWWPFVLAAAGAFAIMTRLDGRGRAVHAVLAGLAIGLMSVLVSRVLLPDAPAGLYDRSATVLPFFVLLLAALGIASLAGSIPAWKGIQWKRGASMAAAAIVAILVLHIAIAAPREVRYQVLDEPTYSAYAQAAQKLPRDGSLALVDGISTMAFTDITGHPTLYVQYPTSSRPPQEITSFFAGGANDTTFLVAANVSIVVTQRPVNNTLLHAVSPGVYLLDASVRS